MANGILNIVPVMQSTALAVDNVSFVKKKEKSIGDFTSQGVKNIIGASLIGETANIIGSI
jgi:hypothetical protein